MKKHSLNLAIITIFALSTVLTVIPEESTWQKIKNFAARNKGKIIGGGIAAIAAALGIGAAAYAKSKADIAIEKAEVSEIDYTNALLLLSTVGNLPQENAIKFILAYFDEDELLAMWNRNIIKALAYYWDMHPTVLYGKLGLKLTVQQIKQVAEEVSEAVHQGFNKLRGALGFSPKEKPRR